MKCPKCNGIQGDSYCLFCWDKKNLDWIESIFGVDPPIIWGQKTLMDIKYKGYKHEMS